MEEITLFDVNAQENVFELSSYQNGSKYWLASELAKMLEYENYKTFSKNIGKAISVCASLSIDVSDHFRPLTNSSGDYKLDRFACFLIVMNSDIKKPNVAKAQVYFAALADTIAEIRAEQIERIEIRQEVSEKINSLNSVAKNHGVDNYANFSNAGYMGMYNMGLDQLKEIKGVEKKATLFDYMGKRELAANLFRLSETEANVQNNHIFGQKNLENTAKEVGRRVRNIMIENDGIKPELLARQKHIKDVKKEIKSIEKDYKKRDKISKN
ncbi:BRO family protein [Helicobacter sp. 13S00477-4]|uniref:BRO family protein n=1 Tax=Helicobacter sp. 13S00477-4 TaxID=1905759 RepID=UPI000BA6B997|nr:BRO family protein [Helicobacter sp. 13S00477-4]PAF51297.1 hypothetical protein BKH44_06215 [Helicobacter sp. 13S00477-4]